MKYILVTGGVISGLGKGITASSIGVLLKNSGLSVTIIKIDPYLNQDAGMMSPYEHGEVFVLDDGGEVDLDLGNYERFLDLTLTKEHNITTGKIYSRVLRKEREGKYLGKTVQMVPHITNEIKNHIRKVSEIIVENKKPDVCIIELGGTVGDIESMIFLEALRQLRYEEGEKNFCLVHVSLVPNMNEQKSKPTQHSIIELRSRGLIPDLIVCRSKKPINQNIKDKISLFSMINVNNVISVHTVDNIYQVPSLLNTQKTGEKIMNKLDIKDLKPDLRVFNSLANRVGKGEERVIGIVGKYTGLKDSYLSLSKALISAGIELNVNIKIRWMDAESKMEFEGLDGILVPGGFGDRGIYGKMDAVTYAREMDVPFLGICLGLHVVCIEYMRNECGIMDATGEEFTFMKGENVIVKNETGKMQVGSRLCVLKKGTLASKIYGGKKCIYERHRHRYEFDNKYLEIMEEKGLKASGFDNDTGRLEIVEMLNKKFFMAVQFHPELKSRPNRPSPVFTGFVKAVKEKGIK